MAASNRPRGKAVFQFLIETLETSQQLNHKIFAANALSLTNSPDSAQILASSYLTFLSQGRHLFEQSEVRQPFIRMGDLAVPHLYKHSLTGSVPALDDLQAIGTPDAAEAIVSSIWLDRSEEQQFWGRAAIHLATLLPQPEIEDRLRNYCLSEEQKRLENLDWVWQPFNEPTHSALPIIAGRIAYLLSQIRLSAIPKPVPSLDPRLMIPVCGIEIFDQAPKPRTWSLTKVEELLAEQAQTPQVEQQCLQILDEILQPVQNSSSLWRILVSGLPPRMQLELFLNTEKSLHKPHPNHWIKIFDLVQYKFKTSYQYGSILLIAASLSLLAGLGVWRAAFGQPNDTMTGVIGFAGVVILVFWGTVSKGVEEPWEPNLFIKLGAFGLQTYGAELTQLSQNHRVWSGIEVIFKILTTQSAVAVAVAGAGGFAFAFAFAGTVYDGFAFAFAFAGGFAVAFAVAVAVAVAGGFAVAFAGTGTVYDGFAVAFAGTGAFAGAVYGVAILAGLGIGSWYQLKIEPERQWLKFFAVLALPWFCTAPIVLIFAGIGLAYLFTSLAFLPITPWQCAGLVELLLIGISGWLWWWGQKQEAIARNPLQGGVIETTLRTQYGRPRT